MDHVNVDEHFGAPGPRGQGFPLQGFTQHGTHSDDGVDTAHQPATAHTREKTPDEQRETLLAQQAQQGSSTRLRRSTSIVILVLFYMLAAVFAWTITCILTYRPINGQRYTVAFTDPYYLQFNTRVQGVFVQSERWYQAARVIQSAVSVLTIPLASAVCAQAAVVFLQQSGTRKGVTMRQTMCLADKGWTDLDIITRIMFGQWKRYGSSFFLVALLLNVLGGILSPLQEALLTSTSIKTPTWPSYITGLADFADHFSTMFPDTDDNLVVTLTRSRLSSTSATDPQARLWSKEPACDNFRDETALALCETAGGQQILGNLSLLQDPFFTQIPAGFSTGLIRQFAPRINSTAQWDNITAAEFPKNCSNIPGSLYIRYSNGTVKGGDDWSVEVCMPADMTVSPWKPVQTRQDFSEELYLNISLGAFSEPGIPAGVYYGRVTMNTTAGFFELPNYINGEVAGPLLDGEPEDLCGADCRFDDSSSSRLKNRSLSSRDQSSAAGTNQSWPAAVATETLMKNVNKGPLLTITLALFGLGSYLDTIAGIKAYSAAHGPKATNNLVYNMTDECIEIVPLMSLTKPIGKVAASEDELNPCLTTRLINNGANAQYQYLWKFVTVSQSFSTVQSLTDDFTAAAFIANEAWMMYLGLDSGSLSVNYDLGADTEVPAISRAGMIAVSALLGLYLLSLLALALYSAWVPRWTKQLDAFAMMRVGASMADQVPLLADRGADSTRFLDQTPGWFGDATGGEGEVGQLGIGSKTPLRPRRPYLSYD